MWGEGTCYSLLDIKGLRHVVVGELCWVMGEYSSCLNKKRSPEGHWTLAEDRIVWFPMPIKHPLLQSWNAWV